MISFCSYLVTIGEDIGKVKNFFPDISSWRTISFKAKLYKNGNKYKTQDGNITIFNQFESSCNLSIFSISVLIYQLICLCM